MELESNGRLYVLADPDIPWQGSRDVYGVPVLRTTRKFFASTGIKRIRGKDRRARAVPIPFGAARPPAVLRCVGVPRFSGSGSRAYFASVASDASQTMSSVSVLC